MTKSGSAWITIEWLSEELKEYSQINYEELFSLHPVERGKVIMFGQEIISPRWHRSYLKTPKRDTKAKRSFMYSELNPMKIYHCRQNFRFTRLVMLEKLGF